MPKPSPVPAQGRRPLVEGKKLNSRPTPPTVPTPEETLEWNEWVKFWESMNGPGGMSLLFSVFVHSILLGLLAIPVFQVLNQRPNITNIISGDGGGGGMLGEEAGGMALSLPAMQSADDSNLLKDALLEQTKLTPSLLPDLDPLTIPGLQNGPSSPPKGRGGVGQGGGTSSGDGPGGAGGIRIIEPPNAVRAGNFTVFAMPIIGSSTTGNVKHGPPGSSPAVSQPYHIVIRMKVPEGVTSVNLNDFSGRIDGTDSYTQKIPGDAWYYTPSGKLTRARAGRSIPVIEGTAELLIRVPGATIPLVRDTIKVACRLTNEEQEIQLEFVEPGAK